MSFIVKTLIYVVLYVLLLTASYFGVTLCEITAKFKYFDVSTNGIIILTALVSSFLISHIIKSILHFIRYLFTRNKEHDENQSIDNIVELIFHINNDNIFSIQDKYDISGKFKIIRDAILCQRCEEHKISGTFLKNDSTTNRELFIHQSNIIVSNYIEMGHFEESLSIINNIIKNFPQYVYIIKENLLKIAISSIERDVIFQFDPKKSKYKLDDNFIEKYETSTSLKIYYKKNDATILEKMNKIYPQNFEIAKALLSHKKNEYSDKKIIDIIKKCYAISHNRNLAINLWEIQNKSNISEIAKEIVETSKENIVDNLWFLCVIFLKLEQFSKVSAALKDIIIKNNNNINKDILKFYIKYYDQLSHDIELSSLIRKHIEMEEDREWT